MTLLITREAVASIFDRIIVSGETILIKILHLQQCTLLKHWRTYRHFLSFDAAWGRYGPLSHDGRRRPDTLALGRLMPPITSSREFGIVRRCFVTKRSSRPSATPACQSDAIISTLCHVLLPISVNCFRRQYRSRIDYIFIWVNARAARHYARARPQWVRRASRQMRSHILNSFGHTIPLMINMMTSCLRFCFSSLIRYIIILAGITPSLFHNFTTPCSTMIHYHDGPIIPASLLRSIRYLQRAPPALQLPAMIWCWLRIRLSPLIFQVPPVSFVGGLLSLRLAFECLSPPCKFHF